MTAVPFEVISDVARQVYGVYFTDEESKGREWDQWEDARSLHEKM